MQNHIFSSQIKQEIKQLYIYNNKNAFFALLSDYFFIIVAICLSQYSLYFLPITTLIIASRQRALATILHEATHKSLMSNKKLEKIIGSFFSGFLIFQSYESYYKTHIKEHHKYLGKDKDPDFIYYQSSKIYIENNKYKFIWSYILKPIFAFNLLKNVKYLLKNRLLQTQKQELIYIAFMHIFLLFIFHLTIGIYGYFLYWILPYLTFFQALTWFIEISEHYPMIFNMKTNIEGSRNRFSHCVEAFFTSIHNEHLHLIHHLFPAIPFWNLPKAHQILMQDEKYKQLNDAFGGIFISNNNNKSLIMKSLEQFPSNNINTGFIFALLAAACNATIGLFSNFLLENNFQYTDIAFLKTFIAFLILFFYQLKTPLSLQITQINNSNNLQVLVKIAMCALFGIFGLFYFETKAYQFGNIANVVVILMASATVFAIFISYFLLNEKITKNIIIGSILAILGIFIISYQGVSAYHLILNALIAGFSYGFFTILIKKFQLNGGIFLTKFLLLFGSIYLFFPFINHYKELNFSFIICLYLLILAIVPTIGGFYCTTLALRKLKASQVQITELSEPIFAALFALIFLLQIPTISFILAAIFIVYGIYLTSL